MDFQMIAPLQPLWTSGLTGAAGQEEKKEPAGAFFADVFQSAIDNVRDTEAMKNDAEYRLATGQMDNPAEAMVIASQWDASVNLLVQLRNRALDAYNELIRIGL